MADMDHFRSLSAKHGLPLQFVIKEFYVMDLLGKIASAFQKERVVFKGGTALNRCYASGMSRFSEDLDFDYISLLPMKKKIRALESAMKIEGYRIEKPRLFRNRLRFDCFFTNEMGKKDVVRAEFNLSFSRLVGKIQIRPAVSEISGRTIIGLRVYSLEDLMARKVLALHARSEGKDFFDLASFIQKADKNLVKKSLGAILRYEGTGKKCSDIMEQCISKIGSADAQGLKRLTNNYIPLTLRPDWHELIETLKLRMESLAEK
jgi:predicted nucleotidyltransferase component of viral defense system